MKDERLGKGNTGQVKKGVSGRLRCSPGPTFFFCQKSEHVLQAGTLWFAEGGDEPCGLHQ